MRATRVYLGLFVIALVVSACGGGGGDAAVRAARATTFPTAAVTSAPTTSVPNVPTTAPPTTAPTEPAVPSTSPQTSASVGANGGSPVASNPADSPVNHLVGVGSAGQVIAVVADDYGQTTATFTAYERAGDDWRTVFGPWTANLGTSGFAPPGAKREGDGRTPSGAYGFEFFFGVLGNPGVRYPWRDVTSTAIVWDDDPASARYNQWVDSSLDDPGADPEPMYNVPAYNYGAVIAYNSARTPGLGSAIFLHVSKGGPTAGCVALPQGQLVDVMRWLDPAQQPRIVLGTRAAVTS